MYMYMYIYISACSHRLRTALTRLDFRWRTHLEHTKELQENIQSKVPMAKEQLGKLASTISQAKR